MSDNGFSKYNGYDIQHIKLTTLTGVEYDIKNFAVETNIYTSIYTQTVSGSILVNDAVNMLANLPIVGGEKIEVSWRTRGRLKWRRFKFRVEKVSEREDVGKTSSYRLQLISEEQFNDTTSRQSRGYDGAYSDIISKAVGSISSKNANVTPSYGIQKFASPMWSPLELIAWCTKRSVGSDNMPFVFYEDLNGFNFVNVSDLLNGSSNGRLFKQTTGIDNDPERVLRNIEQIDWRSGRDTSSLAFNGVLNNKELTFDFNEKTQADVVRSYDEYFNETPHLDKYQVAVSGAADNIVCQLASPDMSHMGKYKRSVLDSTMHYTSLGIILPGDDEFVLGGVYDFNIPSPEPTPDGKAPTEKYTSGRWLTTDIRHTLRTDGYNMAVEIAKDSYSHKIEGN
ncbi:hypothetical protein NVP1244A_083 [Vibrio phage 1.244.A._10N.261.54.C3]|nr:hypothetical protein NVP1244A_083 [Vibrio phage 1.244.A._10N.261.54.C3]AUR98711.1 hypothetical protein NVP1255O_083 [Vibrio phage 1.255.O._10N.286.45.F1]